MNLPRIITLALIMFVIIGSAGYFYNHPVMTEGQTVYRVCIQENQDASHQNIVNVSYRDTFNTDSMTLTSTDDKNILCSNYSPNIIKPREDRLTMIEFSVKDWSQDANMFLQLAEYRNKEIVPSGKIEIFKNSNKGHYYYLIANSDNQRLIKNLISTN